MHTVNIQFIPAPIFAEAGTRALPHECKHFLTRKGCRGAISGEHGFCNDGGPPHRPRRRLGLLPMKLSKVDCTGRIPECPTEKAGQPPCSPPVRFKWILRNSVRDKISKHQQLTRSGIVNQHDAANFVSVGAVKSAGRFDDFRSGQIRGDLRAGKIRISARERVA